jgi:hypothetical protein
VKSVINEITVVCQQGVGITSVGGIVNGSIIDRIVEDHEFYEDSSNKIYKAFDKEGNLLKLIENCPCDISYKVIDS